MRDITGLTTTAPVGVYRLDARRRRQLYDRNHCPGLRRKPPRAVLFDLDGAGHRPRSRSALNQTLRSDANGNHCRMRDPSGGITRWVALIQLGFGMSRDQPGFEQRRHTCSTSRRQPVSRDRSVPGMAEVLEHLEAHAGLGIVTNNLPAWLTDPLITAMRLDRAPGVCGQRGHLRAAQTAPAPILSPAGCWLRSCGHLVRRGRRT